MSDMSNESEFEVNEPMTFKEYQWLMAQHQTSRDDNPKPRVDLGCLASGHACARCDRDIAKRALAVDRFWDGLFRRHRIRSSRQKRRARLLAGHCEIWVIGNDMHDMTVGSLGDMLDVAREFFPFKEQLKRAGQIFIKSWRDDLGVKQGRRKINAQTRHFCS